MEQLNQFLQGYFELPASSLGKLAEQFEETTLSRKDFFLKEGDACKHLSFVKSGFIRIYRNMDGKEVTQWISTPGSFVTDLASFVFGAAGRWNIEALTDCELYTISKERYAKLHHIVPEWHQLEKLFIAKCFVYLEERVLQHLHFTAEERFKQLFDEQPELFNQVPLQYIASMLGMSPETLSRLRNKMVQASRS